MYKILVAFILRCHLIKIFTYLFLEAYGTPAFGTTIQSVFIQIVSCLKKIHCNNQFRSYKKNHLLHTVIMLYETTIVVTMFKINTIFYVYTRMYSNIISMYVLIA